MIGFVVFVMRFRCDGVYPPMENEKVSENHRFSRRLPSSLVECPVLSWSALFSLGVPCSLVGCDMLEVCAKRGSGHAGALASRGS